MSNRNSVTKYSAYAILLIVCFVLENSRSTAISVFGGGIKTAPFIVVAIAAFEGPIVAGILGFFAGILESIHTPLIEGVSSIGYVLYTAVFGFLSERYLRPVLPTVVLGGVVFMGIGGLIRHVFYYGLVFNLTFAQGMKEVLFEILLSILPGVLMFFIVRGIYRRFSAFDER